MNNINFYGIPMMPGIEQHGFKTVDCGAGNYVTKIEHTNKDKYMPMLIEMIDEKIKEVNYE